MVNISKSAYLTYCEHLQSKIYQHHQVSHLAIGCPKLHHAKNAHFPSLRCKSQINSKIKPSSITNFPKQKGESYAFPTFTHQGKLPFYFISKYFQVGKVEIKMSDLHLFYLNSKMGKNLIMNPSFNLEKKLNNLEVSETCKVEANLIYGCRKSATAAQETGQQRRTARSPACVFEQRTGLRQREMQRILLGRSPEEATLSVCV